MQQWHTCIIYMVLYPLIHTTYSLLYVHGHIQHLNKHKYEALLLLLLYHLVPKMRRIQLYMQLDKKSEEQKSGIKNVKQGCLVSLI